MTTDQNTTVLLGSRMELIKIMQAVDEHGTHEEESYTDEQVDLKEECTFSCGADAEWAPWQIDHLETCPVAMARKILEAMGATTWKMRMEKMNQPEEVAGA